VPIADRSTTLFADYCGTGIVGFAGSVTVTVMTVGGVVIGGAIVVGGPTGVVIGGAIVGETVPSGVVIGGAMVGTPLGSDVSGVGTAVLVG